jgi:PHP family Zn ribbon phosphoesterase
MVKIDLHIHSALSACAENIMSPGRILHKAHQSGLNMVAITDHNASGSLHVASLLAAQYNIKLIFGMEVSTWEDVHLLALFDSLDQIVEFQSFIDKHLPELENMPDIYGYQVIYNEHNEIVDVDLQLRQTGIQVNLTDTVTKIHECHGIAVPAHVMRGKFSVTSQLGFIDSSADFDLVEIAATRWRRENRFLGEKIRGFTAMPNSDAHFLNDVGRTYFELPHLPDKLAELSELISSLII